MKKLLTIAAIFFLFSTGKMLAQSYDASVGLRLGFPIGLTGKFFISETDAIEGLVFFDFRNQTQSIGVTGLYERHADPFNIPELLLYYGVGGGVGVWTHDGNNNGGIGVGLDAIIGIEYSIPDVPLNVSLDVKPNINLIPSVNFGSINPALSIRYIFK